VIERLKNGGTPQPLGNRVFLEHTLLRVCHETIFRYAYSMKGHEKELRKYLPLHKNNWIPRRTRKRQKPNFVRDVSISLRPDDVTHRRQFGHWEGDLMLFKQNLGQTNVTSLVGRVSRVTVILKNPNKRAKLVMG
jgi:IS30 family transposase